jgi:hypothetical protein
MGLPCRRGLLLALGTGVLLGFAGAAVAQPGPAQAAWLPSFWFGQIGRASSTTTAALGLGWDWGWQRRWGERGVLSGFHEVSIGHWRADDVGGGHATVTQAGIAPVLRYWWGSGRSGWFGEAGLGANVVVPIYRTRDKRFSTTFNFSEHLGAGYRSADGAGEWSLRVQHFSNGGIEKPNPGENFVQLRWTMAFGGAGVRP